MFRMHVILLALLSSSSLTTGVDATIPSVERQALIALHDSTGGTQWLDRQGWLGPVGSECNWSGVTCDGTGSAIVRIALAENNLEGTIPMAIGDLEQLEEIDLSLNFLAGQIPGSIGGLSHLRILELADNELVLPLPASLFSLGKLVRLDLSGNRFDGSLPPSLGDLDSLESLDIAYNAFRSAVPASLLALTNLEDGESDFRFNALTTSDPSVQQLLDRKQIGGDWTSTQTVPPQQTSITLEGLTWTPVPSGGGPGHYRIEFETQSGSPFTVLSTSSRMSSRYDVSDVFGELSATIHAVSVPHRRQKNLIISEPSTAVEFTNFGYAPDFPFFQFGVRPEPLVQINGVPQNSTYFTIVNYGGFGGDAFLEQDGDFFALSESEFFIDRLSTKRVDVTSQSQPPGEYEGEVVLSGEGVFQPVTMPISLLSISSPLDPDGAPDQKRFDLISGRTPLRSTAIFRNDGDEELSGAVTSDVPWIVPVTESVSIPPGASAEIEFDIDPEARLDASSESGVSFSGTLRLDYADQIEQSGKGVGMESQHTTGVSTTLSTVVSTVPPAVSNGTPPPFGGGESGFLIPGLRQDAATFADIAIANAFGALRINDLRAFFSRTGATGTSQSVSFNQLGSRHALMLGAPGRTIFSQPSGSGAMQVRSSDAGAVLVSARRLAIEEEGLVGTALPVFAAERLTAPGDRLYLTGLSASVRADLLIQSASALGAIVSVDMLDSQGEIVGKLGPLNVDGWNTLELQSFAPASTATAILSVDEASQGPVVAYALLHGTGFDPWVAMDWSAYWDELRTTPLIVPVARRDGPVPTTDARRRTVTRPGATPALTDRTTVVLTMFNPASSESTMRLNFHGFDGGTYEMLQTIPAAHTRTVADVVAALGATGTIEGYLTITPLRGAVVADARLMSHSDGSTTGSTIPLHPRGSGARLGERRSIAAVEDSRQKTIDAAIATTWQTRFQLLETSGESAKVSATIRVATGSALAAAVVRREFDLAPNQLLQLGPIARAIMGEARETSLDDLHDLVVEFNVIEGNGSVLIITEMIENATGDTLIRFD